MRVLFWMTLRLGIAAQVASFIDYLSIGRAEPRLFFIVVHLAVYDLLGSDLPCKNKVLRCRISLPLGTI